MTISQLQSRFINFAKGMPAIAFGNHQIKLELEAILARLKGSYPHAPATPVANIPMPVYGLAFSVFMKDLTVQLRQGFAELDAQLVATIHRLGRPDEVIREYIVKTRDPIRIVFDYDAARRELFWRQDGIAIPEMVPSWDPNADANLASTTIPDPKRDNFLTEVEAPILWTTRNAFVSLLIDVLPHYPIGEMAPWLTFQEPLLFDFNGNHVIVTASRAQISVGGCSPSTVVVDPDPNFPYGETIPSPTFSGDNVDIAVYLPKTRLVNFVAGTLQPAVLISAGGSGGVIKWGVSGSFGLKELMADIKTGVVYPTGLTVSGVIGLFTAIDFVGAARAWVDGPSGTKIGLASGSVIGSGEFAADIRLEADLAAGYISGDLVVTQSQLTNIDFDVSTPFGWPLDAIAGEILDHVARSEIRKLTRQVVHLGRWEFLGIPLSYLDSLGTDRAYPVMEGLKNVACHMGVMRQLG